MPYRGLPSRFNVREASERKGVSLAVLGDDLFEIVPAGNGIKCYPLHRSNETVDGVYEVEPSLEGGIRIKGRVSRY